MKKLLVTLVLVAILLSACQPAATTDQVVNPTEPASQGEAVLPATADMYSVKIIQWPGPEGDATQKVVDWFNANKSAEAGYKVELLLFGRDQMTQKQEAIMAAGTDDADIFFIASRQFGKYLTFIEPLDAYFADPKVNPWGGSKEAFMPSSLKGVTGFDGKLYGAPRDISANFLYYRKDYIDQLLSDAAWQETYKKISKEQMGVEMTPKPPEEWTWDDYLAASYFFTKQYNPDSPTEYGNFTHGKVLGPTAFLWNNAYFSYGGDWFDAEGNPAFDNDATRKAIELWKTFFNEGLTPPGSVNGEYPECNEAIMAGQVALAIHWNAAFNTLDAPESAVSGKIGITAPPAGPEGHVVWNHTLAYAMNKASTHKNETASFMAWLFTEEAAKMYAESGGIPPYEKVLKEMTNRPDFAVMADVVAKYGRSLPPTTGIIERQVCEILTNAWTGSIDTEEAIKQLQETSAEELSKWNFK